MGKGKKILIVEDDIDLREAITMMLENSGYCVTQAGNGDVGQFMTLLSDYNLLISDIGIPDVDGITMTKFIKSRVSTPVILITGQLGLEVEERAKEAKAEALLIKPFRIESLLAEIKRILG